MGPLTSPNQVPTPSPLQGSNLMIKSEASLELMEKLELPKPLFLHEDLLTQVVLLEVDRELLLLHNRPLVVVVLIVRNEIEELSKM